MTYPVLLAAAAALTQAPVLEHRTTHDGAAADYRAQVQVALVQVGGPAPGGRPATLACRWTARLVVERTVRLAGDTILSRRFEPSGMEAGTRPGWCTGQRRSVEREVARRRPALHGRLVAAAAEDAPVLARERARSGG